MNSTTQSFASLYFADNTNFSESISATATASEINGNSDKKSLEISNADALNTAINKINIDIDNLKYYTINSTVNSITKTINNIYEVKNLNDFGSGSLREAIKSANTVNYSKILFLVSGVITLKKSLPIISKTVVIDGTTIAGYSNIPLIEINCNNNKGLIFDTNSDNSILLGLCITNSISNGITVHAKNITFDKNVIGLDLNGNINGNNDNGIYLSENASSCLIGINPTKSSSYVSNIISGNKKNGIKINGGGKHFIRKNYIGTDLLGITEKPNGNNGIYIDNSIDCIIGGDVYENLQGQINNPTGSEGTTTPVFIIPPEGNLISCNKKNGVFIHKSSLIFLYGNFIGTTYDGNSALSNKSDGLLIKACVQIYITGCNLTTNPFVFYNVISGNGKNGIHITDSKETSIQGNFTGISANNSLILGNAKNGILIDGLSEVTDIGGVIPLGNVCSGNGQNGVVFAGSSTNNNNYNTFAGVFAFGGAAPNNKNGILINTSGKHHTIRTCVLSGNKENGIEINNSSDCIIGPLICGMNSGGTAPIPNEKNGLLITNKSNNNLITKVFQSVIYYNTFSGNNNYGIEIKDGANNNTICDCNIGLNPLFFSDIYYESDNLKGGILIGEGCPSNFINENYVGYNKGIGIECGKSKNNVIVNNRIGYTRVETSASNTINKIVDNGIDTYIRNNIVL